MAARIFYQEDCNLSVLEGQKIAIIGYGSQGHAHALNLKDSGCDVIIGLYEGSKSWKRAEEQGFQVFTAAEAAKHLEDCDCRYCLYYGGRRKGKVNCLADECVCAEEIRQAKESYRRERSFNGS